MVFSSCGIMPGFGKSSHIYVLQFYMWISYVCIIIITDEIKTSDDNVTNVATPDHEAPTGNNVDTTCTSEASPGTNRSNDSNINTTGSPETPAGMNKPDDDHSNQQSKIRGNTMITFYLHMYNIFPLYAYVR